MSRRPIRVEPEQILAWLKQHFDVKVPGNGRQARICNPFDPADDDFHLWVSLYRCKPKSERSTREDYWVHDFRPEFADCNVAFLQFVKRYRKLSFAEAVREVCGSGTSAATFLERTKEKAAEERRIQAAVVLPPGAEPIQEGLPRQRLIYAYLRRRGFTVADAVRYQLHCTVDSVVFPYYEFEELVSWQARRILGKDFLFPDDSTKSSHLFAFDFCEPEGELGITEAAFGAMTLGGPMTASGGAALNEVILPKLRLLKPSRIVLAPDNDAAGLKSLRLNFQLLEEGLETPLWYCLPPQLPTDGEPTKDWADVALLLGRERTREFYRKNVRRLTVADRLRPFVAMAV